MPAAGFSASIPWGDQRRQASLKEGSVGRADLDELLELIREAICGTDSSWISFLEKLRDATSGCQAALFIQGLGSAPTRMLSLGDPERDRAYSEHYGAINPWFTKGADKIEPGGVVTSEWYPAEDLRRSEFHADWLRPQDMFYAINGFIFDGPGFVGNIAVAKPWSKDGFGSDDVRLFNLLMPELQHAVRLQRQLGLAGQASLCEAMDQLPHAIFLTDLTGRVRQVNRAAQNLLDRKRGLSLGRQGELRAEIREQNTALQKLLAAAGAARAGGGTAGGVLKIGSAESRRPLALTVSPARSRVLAFEGQPVALLVFVADPESQSRPHPDTLALLYDLTPREAQVAAGIAMGKKLTRVAKELRINRETADTHLGRVLYKTDTHSQIELQRLVLLGSPHDHTDDRPAQKSGTSPADAGVSSSPIFSRSR
jgi:DNA-binding CsgD family transcriptional regulator/PAS domain-containing protein